MNAATHAESTRLSISGMHCAGCVGRVEKSLLAVAGVEAANVNLAERTATVTGHASPEALVAAVKQAGYDATVLRSAGDESESLDARSAP